MEVTSYYATPNAHARVYHTSYFCSVLDRYYELGEMAPPEISEDEIIERGLRLCAKCASKEETDPSTYYVTVRGEEMRNGLINWSWSCALCSTGFHHSAMEASEVGDLAVGHTLKRHMTAREVKGRLVVVGYDMS